MGGSVSSPLELQPIGNWVPILGDPYRDKQKRYVVQRHFVQDLCFGRLISGGHMSDARAHARHKHVAYSLPGK